MNFIHGFMSVFDSYEFGKMFAAGLIGIGMLGVYVIVFNRIWRRFQ